MSRCDCAKEGKWWLGEHRPAQPHADRPACPAWLPADKEAALYARRAREATERRNEAIQHMRSEGASLRTIAEKVGLSHSAIAKIVDGENALLYCDCEHRQSAHSGILGRCTACGCAHFIAAVKSFEKMA